MAKLFAKRTPKFHIRMLNFQWNRTKIGTHAKAIYSWSHKSYVLKNSNKNNKHSNGVKIKIHGNGMRYLNSLTIFFRSVFLFSLLEFHFTKYIHTHTYRTCIKVHTQRASESRKKEEIKNKQQIASTLALITRVSIRFFNSSFTNRPKREIHIWSEHTAHNINMQSIKQTLLPICCTAFIEFIEFTYLFCSSSIVFFLYFFFILYHFGLGKFVRKPKHWAIG